jgi:hypothetical protein
MGDLAALLPNGTPLVRRFFAERSKKRQRCAIVNLENNFSILEKLRTFTVIVSKNYPRISRKMRFITEERAFLTINNQFINK